MKEQAYKILDKVKKNLKNEIFKGKEKGDFEGCDYLQIYEELLALGYKRDEIFKWLLANFEIDSIKLEELSELEKDELKILFSSMIELEKSDYPFIELILKLFIKAAQTDCDHIIAELPSLIEQSFESNKKTHAYDSSTGIESKNNTQRLLNLSKLYLDLCEGVYSLALNLVVFNVDVLNGKKRTLDAISNFDEKSKLRIIKSFDSKLFLPINMGYNSIIRNGSAHSSYGVKEWPKVYFTNTNRSGEKETIIITEDDLIDKLNKLFRVSQAIFTANVLANVHSSFKVFKNYTNTDVFEKLDQNEFFRKYNN